MSFWFCMLWLDLDAIGENDVLKILAVEMILRRGGSVGTAYKNMEFDGWCGCRPVVGKI